ncbi:dephospho-CoA kinase [Rhodobacter capsulatus]|uniref:dephospho-CoA kinase n=1 Tax=Rhodobacter capsulatus TaxID=1061 RepID=UPI0003D2E702|nr:dephospho-CoA kinase [Rhodobacter capsulatus]ETD77987.1 dephospho-CoA kinase [Rhodobacter capsulatus B6]
MKGPFRLGLTGSIGMGKSTTARLFAEEGIPVWDADATVHALYAKGGAAVAPLSAIFPDAIRDGAVDRDRLKTLLQAEKQALSRLESVVHPLVQAARQAFLLAHETADLILFDIPLLYETGADKDCDAVLVVTAAPDVQRARVLARGQMTETQLDMILARQLPDAEKRRRADHVIETLTLEQTRAEVRKLIATLRSRHA